MKEIEALIVGMARDNPNWGYLRIVGALQNVGHKVARTTIANVLMRHGLEPAPEQFDGVELRGVWGEEDNFHWMPIKPFPHGARVMDTAVVRMGTSSSQIFGFHTCLIFDIVSVI